MAAPSNCSHIKDIKGGALGMAYVKILDNAAPGLAPLLAMARLASGV